MIFGIKNPEAGVATTPFSKLCLGEKKTHMGKGELRLNCIGHSMIMVFHTF